MKHDRTLRRAHAALAAIFVLSPFALIADDAAATQALEQVGIRKGICAVLGLPEGGGAQVVTGLASSSELRVYFQAPDPAEVAAVRVAADAAGLLGRQVFASPGDWTRLHLADNLAGAILVSPAAAEVAETELLRVLHPGGRAISKGRTLTKPFPTATDSWSHPYHGPDNNPQSLDRLARAPYRTQFLADPKFSPMPEVTVAAGGRIFKAMGHIAHKANQNAMINTLLCINAFNGTILWKRPLPQGFMIHRNTMVATPEHLYMADLESCKVIDAATGETVDQIAVPEGISDGPVWKWMALQDGVLYALVGGSEATVRTQKSNTPGLGHWPWGMWEGHDYKNPKNSFGFGRTFLAIDLKTKRVIWHHRDEAFIDSRGVCKRGGSIYFYSPEKFLAVLDAETGTVLWKNADEDLLRAIGPNGRAQHYVTGYATTAFMKANDKFLFFAGPQRPRLVAASTKDGKLLWQKDGGNLQLLLRDDALYVAGPQSSSAKLSYDTGKVLAQLPTRRACTRATGSIDSIFYRTSGGTVRYDMEAGAARHIAPMRPPCQDGVIISDGHLFWGPWMCGCQLSFYGHIALAPAGEAKPERAFGPRHETGEGGQAVRALPVAANDWPTYQGDNARSCATEIAVPRTGVTQRWSYTPSSAAPAMPTAAVSAGGLVYVADRSGAVRALDGDGELLWKAYTGGPVYFPPAIADGRAFVGSADGRVYAFEAATGRMLWSYRVAPEERRISVYGSIISTWPVAGGVVVKDGTVFAAAGIAHYDGTHVVALDAATGKPSAYNGTSGVLSEAVDNGVSLQGALSIVDDELRFLAGGVYETARYELGGLRCLNEPKGGVTSQFRTAFYPYYPDYGKYVSLDYLLPDGGELSFDASYEGSRFTPLAKLAPLPEGSSKVRKFAARWGGKNVRDPRRKAIWKDRAGRRFTGFVVAPEVILATGHRGPGGGNFLTAINRVDGSDRWSEALPALAVKGGVAIDAKSRIVVSLENGTVLCYGGREPR